ncbi:NAD(P)/FAD-dependent oxidoreductase [Pleurocapsales cyanobacterium LEGE 06147]|nr:NAD(P)/FAD-dependent oxidoreductase [Pleurocapsales cyanobacterium LEGE 06147]
MESYDAIIIGSGPNALVNAAYLTKAGWSVLILEKNDRPGGGVRTEELTIPGFHHDVYAGFLVLFALSQAYADFGAELKECGLTLVNTNLPTGVSMPGGKVSVLSTDMDANVAEAERLATGDGAAWQQMLQNIGQYAPQVFSLLKTDLTTPEAAEMIKQLMLTSDGKNPSPFAVEFLLTARDVLESMFQSEVWRGLLTPWVLHTGHGPEDANSGFWVQLFALGAQTAGLPVAIGGAEMVARALVRLIQNQGGKVYTNSTVTRILVKDGKAVGVRTEAGDEYSANRAVIATTNPDQLYLKLLADTDVVPPLVKQQADNFRYGHSVLVIHLALSEPPRWHNERLNQVVYTHITDGLDGVSRNYNETTRRLLPSSPVIGVGTPTTLDPSRAPAGQAVMVLQVLDTPFWVHDDAANKIDVGDGTWTDDLKNRFADRVIDIVGQHIPNLSDAILGRSIVSPLDLARYNPNWKYGDWTSGSHALAQSYLLRPLSGQPSHRTVVPNLFMIGAATFPGLGLGAGSGYILAQELIKEDS